MEGYLFITVVSCSCTVH